jgi:hypothetical protein
VSGFVVSTLAFLLLLRRKKEFFTAEALRSQSWRVGRQRMKFSAFDFVRTFKEVFFIMKQTPAPAMAESSCLSLLVAALPAVIPVRMPRKRYSKIHAHHQLLLKSGADDSEAKRFLNSTLCDLRASAVKYLPKFTHRRSQNPRTTTDRAGQRAPAHT